MCKFLFCASFAGPSVACSGAELNYIIRLILFFFFPTGGVMKHSTTSLVAANGT